MISILYRLLTAAVQRQLGRTRKACILPSIIIIDFIIFCFPGVAGCCATLLHDAVMNPADGKAVSFLLR